jgi:hypothetical protein
MDLIGNDISYYKDNKQHFTDLYAGKYLVIKGMEIVGIYESNSQALEETLKQHERGTFIIEHPLVVKAGKNPLKTS